MSDLELKKKKLELSKVKLAREELELRIMERMEEIGRINDAIKKQLEREQELENELK
jgi:hypothetical protein